jgi:hypothetical protein
MHPLFNIYRQGEQRFAEREGGGDGFFCPDWDSADSQIWDYDRRLATEQGKDCKGPLG